MLHVLFGMSTNMCELANRYFHSTIFHLNLIVLRIETEREIKKKTYTKNVQFCAICEHEICVGVCIWIFFLTKKIVSFFGVKCEMCSFPYSMVFMIILTVWIWNVDKKSTAWMIAILSVHSVSVIRCYLRFAVVWLESFQRCLCFQLSHRLSRAKRHRTAETYNKTYYIHVKCATKSILTEFNYSNSITLS